jgi:large subunit ribosomal protein L9
VANEDPDMATEVLLMQDVPDLGKEGDVVQVADGYARNYLLPRSLAAPVTEAMRRRLARLREQREAARRDELNAARELANRLVQASVTIAVRTSDAEHLYGSVTAADIVDALAQQGLELDRHALRLEQPIRELGVFDVPVRLHPEVETTVKVWVVEE